MSREVTFHREVFVIGRIALLAVLLVGCMGDTAPVTAGSSVIDSAGISIVTSSTPVWADGAGWQVDSVPITVLGADESDVQQQWQWVIAAARFSNGNVVLAVEGSLRLFGPDGTFLREMSQTGDGPGEFRYIRGLLPLADDSLRVSDDMGRQVAIYAPDGSLAREEPLDWERFRALGRWGECETGLLADGSRFSCQQDSTIPATATNRPNRVIEEGWTSPGPGLLRQLRRIYVVPPDLSVAHPLGIDGGIEQFGFSVGGQDIFVVHPFYSRSLIAAGGTPLRIAIATNPEYRIEMWTPDGKLERIIQRAGGRRVPTAEEIADAPNAMKRYLDRLDPVMKARLVAAIPVPDSLPAVAGMVVAPSGELLVQLPGKLISTWDVFDSTGHWLGQFQIPGRCRILSVANDHLVVQRILDADEVLIEVYRLRKG